MSNKLFSRTQDEPPWVISFFWSLFFWIAAAAGIMWICGIWRIADTLVGFFAATVFNERLLFDADADTSKKISRVWAWVTVMCLALWLQGHCPLWIFITMALIWVVFVSLKWLTEKWLDGYEESTYQDSKEAP